MPASSESTALPACLLGILVPGFGHLYLGRRLKGLVFLGAIGLLFLLGVTMDARLSLYVGFGDPLALLRSLAQMAIGVPYFLVRSLGYGMGAVTSVTHEYGNTFTEVGGLLNILVVLDAYDTAVGAQGMIASHLISLLVFSGLVSIVFAFLQRDDARARLQFGFKVFGGFVLSTFLLGWVMAQFPR